MSWLAPAFLLTAFAYALAGFGGGSTYNALLVLAKVDYRLIPTIALSCNIIVTAGASIQFARDGAVPWRRVLPVLMVSVPMAFVGGRLSVDPWVFTGLLGVALFVAAGFMLRSDASARTATTRSGDPLGNAVIGGGIGGGIGLLAGITGIGGGVFLAPILHLTRWDTARAVAATCSVFIVANSLAGLAGQLLKLEQLQLLGEVGAYAALFPVVLVGGLAGNHLTRRRLPGIWIRRITAALLIYVSVRLLLVTLESLGG